MQFTYENLILNFYPPILMLEQQIIQLDLSYCWAFGVKWSPSGNTLAYVGEIFLFLVLAYIFCLLQLLTRY